MMIARLFLQPAAEQRKSAAMIFADLSKEYYTVLLELVVGPLLTEGERQTVMASLQCDELRKQALAAATAARRCLFFCRITASH